VYFAAGGGPESAATPLFETINVLISGELSRVVEDLTSLGLVHQAAASELLAPLQVFTVPTAPGGSVADRALELLPRVEETTGVEAAEFDWLKLETYTAVPNDPLFGQQWDMTTIALPGGLDLESGANNVWIAIVDSDFDLGHPDLRFTPNVAPTLTHFNADQALAGNPPPYNAGSAGVFHGTCVAGIAAAAANNGIGVAGVAGGCPIMPVRLGAVPSANRVAAGINWAANNGARVASMSLGTTATMAATNAVSNAWGAGLVLCAATGNNGGDTTSPSVNFPANDANVIAVGASDTNDQRKRPASADGEIWGSQFGPEIDVVAPGVQIWTTDEQGASGFNNNNGGAINVAGANYASSGDAAGDYFSVFNGTSAATPHVAGLAGLLISINPGSTNQQVRYLIESSCDKVSPALYPYAFTAAHPNGSWHEEVGYGRVNVLRALTNSLTQIWHNDQEQAVLGGAWTGWNFLSHPGDRAKSIVVVPNSDGRLHAFMIGMDDQIWHNDQEQAVLGGAWTGWTRLSIQGDRATKIAVVPNSDGRLHAFMTGVRTGR
jgi:subtilisin family serine protease